MRQATINPHGFRALSTLLVALASAVGVPAVGPNRTRESRNTRASGLRFRAKLGEESEVEVALG
jgi:hypothetical protein